MNNYVEKLSCETLERFLNNNGFEICYHNNNKPFFSLQDKCIIVKCRLKDSYQKELMLSNGLYNLGALPMIKINNSELEFFDEFNIIVENFNIYRENHQNSKTDLDENLRKNYRLFMTYTFDEQYKHDLNEYLSTLCQKKNNCEKDKVL